MKKRTKCWLHTSVIVLVASSVGSPLLAVAEAVTGQEKTTQLEVESQLIDHHPFAILDTTEEEPTFFFKQSRINGEAKEQLFLYVLASMATTQVQINFPKEATLVTDNLPAGVTAEAIDTNVWQLSSTVERVNFPVPVRFDEVGEHELHTESGNTSIIVIEESKEDEVVSEDLDTDESNEIDSELVNQPDDETEEALPDLTNDSEKFPIDEVESEVASFDGNIAEVENIEQFRAAIADDEISTIILENNITENVANTTFSINRSLKILGQGNTLTFSQNTAFFQLNELEDEATFRMEDIIITKSGTNPLISATATASDKWTLELEDVSEVNANTMRLATIPEGKVHFTGGVTNFTRTTSTATFIEAKEIHAFDGADVTISRGNATIFFSPTTVSSPKISIRESASISITTTSGTANTIDFRGEQSSISIENHSLLQVNTVGTTGTPTNTSNNVIALVGNQPSITVKSQGQLTTTSTNAKRGLHLSGENPAVMINDGTLSVQAATREAVNLAGVNPSLNVVNSEVALRTTTGNTMNLVGDAPVYNLNNSDVTMNSSTGVTTNISGLSPKVTWENASVSLTSTTGQRLNLLGNTNEENQTQLKVINSEIMMNATTGRGVFLQGNSPEVVIDNSQWSISDTGASQGMILSGIDASLLLDNESNLSINGAGTGTLENILIGNNQARPTLSIKKESSLNITTSSGTTAASNTVNNAIHLRGESPYFELVDNSEVNVNITSGHRRGIFVNGANAETIVKESSLFTDTNNGTGFASFGINGKTAIDNGTWKGSSSNGVNIHHSGSDNELEINNQSEMILDSNNARNIFFDGNQPKLSVLHSILETESQNADSITLSGSYAALNIIGKTTRVEASSLVSAGYQNATVYIGTGSGASPGANLNISQGAKVEITSNLATALALWSENGKFDLSDEAELRISQGSSSATASGAAAALRFLEYGGYEFNIDNAKMFVEKTGGSTPGIRMYGGDNQVNVRNGGYFVVNNPGNGTGNNGGTGTNNQGISYSGGSGNSFSVDGVGSQVKVNAGSGPALDMGSSSGRVSVTNGGYFTAVGRTSTAAGGIFNSGVFTVEFDNPLFMDFRNNRPGGGNIFNVSNGSTLTAVNSDLAVWKNGAELEGDPDLNFRTLDYAFSGTNFNTLQSTNRPEELNTEIFGTTGFTAYSRMSSNNGRWAIADELHLPTNADKKVYGHVSLPVGLDDKRSAWDDEAEVTIEVERANGLKEEYTARTKGHSYEDAGISIYGKEPRGGLFEVELDEYLQKGDKVRIINAELTSGELTSGFENQILTETVEVFPIIPPKPATFSSDIIAVTATSIQGQSENPDVEVTATHNDIEVDTSNVIVDTNGQFSIDLSGLSLQVDDEIQIFLRDKEGSALSAGIDDAPYTNNEVGNINPAQQLDYHDATFEQATVLTVGHVGPVSPVDPINPDEQVNPDNPPVLPEDQGLVSIDFVSQFNFGEVAIQAGEATYEALPQRLLNEDGTVNTEEERPNYVQISDRRSAEDRGGWSLFATLADDGFKNDADEILRGAAIHLANQELDKPSANTNSSPHVVRNNGVVLAPGVSTRLLDANSLEGQGTWIYRFGNQDNARNSVKLEVPAGANPKATNYQGTIEWQLSIIPGND